jgi:hypothetical protein
MKVDDLFDPVKVEDVFGFETVKYTNLKTDFINSLAKAPHPDVDELELAKTLLTVLRDDFVGYGTDGGDMRLDDQSVKTVLRAAKLVTKRNNLKEPVLPFRDFSGWGDYWRKEGMSGGGSWAVRRGFIQDIFNPIIDAIEEKQDEIYFSELSTPVSEQPVIGDWVKLKDEMTQLRNRFATARTPQDFSAVGTACVRIIEGLSRVAYKQDIHGEPTDTSEPPVDKTKIRIGRVIEVGLGGRKNAELRSLANSSSEVAHKVKHATTPNKLQAGIACDATILLASIVQRIETARSEEAEV